MAGTETTRGHKDGTKVLVYFTLGILLILAPPIELYWSTYSPPPPGAVREAGVQPQLRDFAQLLIVYLEDLWGYALTMPQLFALQLIGLYLILRGARILLENSNSPSAKRILKMWTG